MDGAVSARVRLGGQWYVIVRESDFRRLSALADRKQPAGLGLESALIGELLPLAATGGTLGDRLVERRRRAGLTQVGLARRAGIRVETLNRIERGRTTPDFATIRKLVLAMRALAKEA